MLKASSDQSLSLSAAGRKFQLGIVYDAYKHQLFEDLNLLAKWSDYIPKKRPCPCLSLDLKSSYTTNERMEAFRFGGHMKVGAAFGIFALGSASASYIQDMSSSIGQARMTLQYKQTIRYEELDTATIQKLSGNHEVLKSAMERGATHFVAGMTYGNQVLMDFKSTKRHAEEHDLLDIELKGLLSLGQSFADNLRKDKKTMTNLDDIQCNIFCESKDIKQPASFKEALEIYQNLPTTLQNVEAVESAYLLPLSLLDEDGKQFEQSHIDEVAMIKLVYVRDDLHEQELQCDAMQERGINTSKIRDDIKKYTEKLKCSLSDTGVERWKKKLEKHNSSKFEIHKLQKQMRKDFVLIAARTCSRCKKELSSESELAQHMKDHEARTCSRCKKELSSESELAQHMKDHEDQTYSRCTKHFSTQGELAEHMKDHEDRSCSMCTMVLSTQSELAEHMKVHEDQSCSMCTMVLSAQSELAEHMKDHEDRSCSMCTMVFSTQSELAEHMKDHEDRSCSMCTMDLSTQSELAEHMKDHEDRSCSMCTMVFSTQSELAEHMKDHEDDARVPGFLAVGAADEASGGAVVGSVLGPAGTVVGTAAGTVVRPRIGGTVGIFRRIYRNLKSLEKDKHRSVEGK